MREQLKENRWVVIALCLFFLWGIEKIEHKWDTKSQFETIYTLQEQKDRYEVEVDKLGAQTARQEVLLIESEKNYAQLLSDFQDLERTKAQTRVITRTSVDSVFIPVTSIDTIYFNRREMPIYSFRDTSSFYNIQGRVSPELALIEEISFPNNITFSHRWERKNLLSKKTYFVEVKNSNPYVRIQGVQNYQIQDDKRFYETGKFWFGVGIVSGIIIK